MSGLRLSFRGKLFAALLGLLLPTLAVVLITVNRQTDEQVRAFTATTINRANEAFREAETSNRTALEAMGQRFAAASRVAALIRSSLFEVDTAFVVTQLIYELQLAGADSALLAITDIQGEPLAGVVRHARLPDLQAAVPVQLLDSLFARGDSTAFGYHLMGDELYSVFVSLVRVVDQPTGFLIVGQPIGRMMAQRLGSAVEGEVCFVAAGRCVAATASMTGDGPQPDDMVAAAAAGTNLSIRRDGARWLLLPSPLGGGAGWRVIAKPLDAVLQPFEEIKSVLLRVSMIALFLALILAIFVARGFARPVRALVAATSRIARGDFTAQVPVTTSDELGTLSRAFNEMSDGLLLKEQYRGLLDKVISPEIADEMLKSGITLGGENREVTIVFADIRGFTTFTEGMEPQQVIRLLNEAMERASAVVEREGGVVDKYIGDEIMALFGAPLKQPDDALRAVRAAVGIRAAIQELAGERTARGDARLAIGIGVNTGVVVAGNMGSERRLNYTVLGEAVNVAARLCADAAPGEILIGDATWRAVGTRITAVPAGARRLKGLSRALETYAVQHVP